MLSIIAHQNPFTSKPGTILAVRRIKRALMTNVKIPRARMFIGSVRRIRIGLRTAFTIPKTKAATNAAVKDATCTPGNRYAATKTTIADIIQLIKIFIFILVPSYLVLV